MNYRIDNRDLNTTDLILENGHRVQISPTALINNALENYGRSDDTSDLDDLRDLVLDHYNRIMSALDHQ